MSGSLLLAFLPLFVALGGIASYFLAKLLPDALRGWTGTFAAIWLTAAFALVLVAVELGLNPSEPIWSILRASDLSVVLALLATGLGALAALASQGRIPADGPVHLYYPLFLFALAGVLAVGLAGDLFTLFVAVELSALPSYALVAYRAREDPRAVRAAITYLLQGAAGTLTALLGVSLLYLEGHTLAIGGAAGTGLASRLVGADPTILGLAAVLVLVGYGVKIALVPLHTWLPDAYVHAPAPVTAIMSGATKAGALVALFLTLSVLPAASVPALLGIVVAVLAVLTMTVGNLLALNQTDLRRMLAYSSVAQMGYILLGFGIGMQFGLEAGFLAGFFYAIVYGLTKGGAFLSADLLVASAGTPEIAKMRGVGARHPAVGVAFAVFLFGLIGVPATAGFLGKLLLFQAGMATATLGGVVLALALAANSALSLGYYAPALSTLLFQGHDRPARPDGPLARSASGSVVALAAATIVLGLFPSELFTWIRSASAAFLAGGGP